jgi:hypothetical protein
MRSVRAYAFYPVLAMLILVGGCSQGPSVIATFPVDNLDGMLEQSLDQFNIDTQNSHDGQGSVHMFADKEMKYLLYDIEDVKLTQSSVVWRARVSTEALFRQLYFEIIVFKADGTSRLDRLVCDDVRRNTTWQAVDVEMLLRPDEDVEKIRLLVYTPGPGHIWLDDMEVWDGRPADMILPQEAVEE